MNLSGRTPLVPQTSKLLFPCTILWVSPSRQSREKQLGDGDSGSERIGGNHYRLLPTTGTLVMSACTACGDEGVWVEGEGKRGKETNNINKPLNVLLDSGSGGLV